MIKKIITKLGQTLNGASTWSNMRLNITLIVISAVISILSITGVICYKFIQKDSNITIAEICLYLGVIFPFVTAALMGKYYQAKIENSETDQKPQP